MKKRDILTANNQISKILKIVAVVMFVLCFVGSIGLANEESVEVISGKYSFSDPTYLTTTSFNASMFFGYAVTSSIACMLMFAFGELIDIEDDKRKLLMNLLPDNNSATSKENKSAISQIENKTE